MQRQETRWVSLWEKKEELGEEEQLEKLNGNLLSNVMVYA